VAQQLTRHDALDAHARDELGISLHHRARPLQAAVASAGSFAGGALLPLLISAVAPLSGMVGVVMAGSVLALGVLGALAAYAGGAPIGRSVVRVMLLGVAAIGV